MADAGYNGMAFIAICLQGEHELLMPLKNFVLVKRFLASKSRSVVVDDQANQDASSQLSLLGASLGAGYQSAPDPHSGDIPAPVTGIDYHID